MWGGWNGSLDDSKDDNPGPDRSYRTLQRREKDEGSRRIVVLQRSTSERKHERLFRMSSRLWFRCFVRVGDASTSEGAVLVEGAWQLPPFNI